MNQEDTDRTLLKLTITFGILILLTAAFATWGFVQAQQAAQEARADAKVLAAQVHSKNHVKDILLWCDAINATRAYDRSFVQRVSQGHLTYTLSPLPCQAIADKTRAITK